MYDVLSVEFEYDCYDCGIKKTTINPVLNVNIIPFYTHAMKGLQEAVDQSCKLPNPTCHCCNSNSIIFKHNGSNHLFIDIECLGN